MTRPAENQQTVEAGLYDGSFYVPTAKQQADARAALRDLVAQADDAANVIDAAREVVADAWREQYAPNYSIRPKPLRALATALARLDGAR